MPDCAYPREARLLEDTDASAPRVSREDGVAQRLDPETREWNYRIKGTSSSVLKNHGGTWAHLAPLAVLPNNVAPCDCRGFSRPTGRVSPGVRAARQARPLP
ncbi:uncharacterized protein LOC134764733 [Penaeus indicus]|uniref:uncharacterized protein LOC134764733 n=1 Tax=Penaeus indicus TaxID=29960 RepID=UPI00300C0DD5